MNKIKTIFFDLDDTLYAYKDSNSKIKAEVKAIEHFCKKHPKYKLGDVFTIFINVKDKIKDTYEDLPNRGNREFWMIEFLRKEHQLDLKLAKEMTDIFWEHSIANIDGYYDAEVILKYFKKKGYKLGVISDGIRNLQIERLKATGFYKYFDLIVTSSDTGYEKPRIEFFEKALQLAKTKPVNAVMIGDNPESDIAPAKKLGMKTVWLRRGKRYYLTTKPNNKADIIIRSFLELYEHF